jgi:hypothetical protein
MRKVSKVISFLLMSSGMILLGAFISYVLFGTCGYINAGNSITKMNKVYDGWLVVRDGALREIKQNGEVGGETLMIMQSWKNILDSTNIPACLDQAYHHISQAVQSDMEIMSSDSVSISSGNKIELSHFGADSLRLYKQNVSLVDACIPTCNYQHDYEFLASLLGGGAAPSSATIDPTPQTSIPVRTPTPKPYIAGETNPDNPIDRAAKRILNIWLLDSAPANVPYWFVTYWDWRGEGYVVSLAGVNLSYPEEPWSLVHDPDPKVVWIGTVEIMDDAVKIISAP